MILSLSFYLGSHGLCCKTGQSLYPPGISYWLAGIGSDQPLEPQDVSRMANRAPISAPSKGVEKETRPVTSSGDQTRADLVPTAAPAVRATVPPASGTAATAGLGDKSFLTEKLNGLARRIGYCGMAAAASVLLINWSRCGRGWRNTQVR